MKKNYNFGYCNLGYYILLFIIFVLICWNISLLSKNKELKQSSDFYHEYSAYYQKQFDKCQDNFNNLQVERNFYRLKFIECSNKIEQQDNVKECPESYENVEIKDKDGNTRYQCIMKNFEEK